METQTPDDKTSKDETSSGLKWERGWIHPILPNQPRKKRGKELNKFCPPNRRDDFCLCFYINPSSMPWSFRYCITWDEFLKSGSVFQYNESGFRSVVWYTKVAKIIAIAYSPEKFDVLFKLESNILVSYDKLRQKWLQLIIVPLGHFHKRISHKCHLLNKMG